MTSVFDVIAHEDNQQLLEARKAAVLSSMRVSETIVPFLAAARTQDEWAQRLALVEDDFVGIVTSACQEAGYSDTDKMLRTARAGLNRQAAERFQPAFGREASIHEARKPKLCPYHREVVDISLNSGNPAAGYEAMSAHWGGQRHCEGDGYKGDNCNFRPKMTTQEYWDSKAEKAKERREERERQQQAEQQAIEQAEPEAIEPAEDVATEEPVAETGNDGDMATVHELPTAEPAADAGEAVPMSMAASFREAVGPSPATGDSAQRRVDLSQGGAGPSPKMDKRKWTPNRKLVETEGEGSPHPTHDGDVTDKSRAQNADIRNPREVTQIGENTTERVELDTADDLSSGFGSGGVRPGPPTGTWNTMKGQTPAVTSKADDVHKNPIRELMVNGYGGFVPQAELQRAIEASQ